jgi:hypothetical protein
MKTTKYIKALIKKIILYKNLFKNKIIITYKKRRHKKYIKINIIIYFF